MIKKLLTFFAFASLGSIAWGGVHVMQNDPSITIGSVTMTTGGQGIKFADNTVQTTAATSGGGGASSLEVFVGAARSSPTASITANPSQFVGSVTGSTFTFTLQSSSVTLQGPLPTSLGTVTTGVWNGTPLTAPFLPTTVAYTNSANTFTSSQTVTAAGGLFTTYGTSVGSVTLRNVASGTQCLQADGSGNVTGSGSACGSGSGSGGYAVEPATVTFNLAKGVIGSTMNFTAFNASLTSATVTGTGGLTVTYGAIVGSMTVSDLASGQCVQTTTGGRLTVTGAGCASGSSGASTLAVYTGTSGLAATQVSSPTAIINLDRSQFGASLTGSATAFITIAFSTSNVTGAYTATSTNTFISADASGGSITVTLPTAVGITGKVYHVKMISASSGTNTVTVATTSAQTIDGATTQVMTLQYTNLEVISTGSGWSIL